MMLYPRSTAIKEGPMKKRKSKGEYSKRTPGEQRSPGRGDSLNPVRLGVPGKRKGAIPRQATRLEPSHDLNQRREDRLTRKDES